MLTAAAAAEIRSLATVLAAAAAAAAAVAAAAVMADLAAAVMADLAADLLEVPEDLAADLPVERADQSLLAEDLPVLVVLPMVLAELQRLHLIMLFPNKPVKVVREARVKPEDKQDLVEVELSVETPVSSLRQRGLVERGSAWP